jgi:hypothetical protein
MIGSIFKRSHHGAIEPRWPNGLVRFYCNRKVCSIGDQVDPAQLGKYIAADNQLAKGEQDVSEDPDLIRLALQMVQKQTEDTSQPTTAQAPSPLTTQTVAPPPLPPARANGEPPSEAFAATTSAPQLPATPTNIGLNLHPSVKDVKTAEELAAMILSDLQQMQGCPKAGVNVTVYGYKPWHYWLHFTPAAGRVPHKAELQELCDIIAERLKRLYDVIL